MRITGGTEDHSAIDMSDASFSIIPNTTASLRLIFPNDGERLLAGSSHTISWTGEEFDTVKIEFSADYGDTWSTIVDSLPNTGNYSWLVPGNISDECFIRVSANNGAIADSNQIPFSIYSFEGLSIMLLNPNGGEQLNSDSEYYINWAMTDNAETLILEYSIDGGITWIQIAEFENKETQFLWQVPNKQSDNCLVRITMSTNDGGLSDTSDAVFSITN